MLYLVLNVLHQQQACQPVHLCHDCLLQLLTSPVPCWLQQAIDSAQTHGTLFVASAGNDGDNTDNVQHLPSTISSPVIVAVGATDSYDNFWPQSNFGTKTVQVGRVQSCLHHGCCIPLLPCRHCAVSILCLRCASVSPTRWLMWRSDRCTDREGESKDSLDSSVSQSPLQVPIAQAACQTQQQTP